MNYGIIDVWTRGDVVTHVIAVLLIVMSILSWTVMLYKAVQLILIKRKSKIVERQFWNEKSIEKGAILLGRDGEHNPYKNLVDAARDAKNLHNDTYLRETLSLDEWLQRSMSVAFEEQTGRMTGGLGVLASVGSTSPFIGLFGTVWGIYHALITIGATGESGLAQVAGPVGESLVMTALGLFVAIPAVLGYNAVARNNKKALSKLSRFRHELQTYLTRQDS